MWLLIDKLDRIHPVDEQERLVLEFKSLSCMSVAVVLPRWEPGTTSTSVLRIRIRLVYDIVARSYENWVDNAGRKMDEMHQIRKKRESRLMNTLYQHRG